MTLRTTTTTLLLLVLACAGLFALAEEEPPSPTSVRAGHDNETSGTPRGGGSKAFVYPHWWEIWDDDRVHSTAFNDWINSWFVPAVWYDDAERLLGSEQAAHYFITYFRDLGLGLALYYCLGTAWSISIYVVGKDKYFPDGVMPSWVTIKDQMVLSTLSFPLYALLPVGSEYLCEIGVLRSYKQLSEVGGVWGYLALCAVYLVLVEIGIYWMHRTLHTNKFLYNWVHGKHHKYSHPTTLSPWASVAFNPIDGLLQACPYVIVMSFIPMHYITHYMMLFFTAVWATTIHDALEFDTEPLMGSKYHTMHHTHYRCNYGQFFTFCDWFWGTLKVPPTRYETDTNGKPIKTMERWLPNNEEAKFKQRGDFYSGKKKKDGKSS